MELDLQVCSRARLSRDARFDGKFFIAVLSTRIYCRPICPSPTAQEKNVRYFATATAAEQAGFRPCLRCRPECSPGTPAWIGTPSTVSRALRLIGESGLSDGGVETLAGHLGMGARHLRRLFLRHLGATPSAVAHTRRLHFAKKLLDETNLPMTQVALASGFNCVRRFNAAIRAVYRKTPTEIRRLARRTAIPPPHEYLFRLPYRPPYHWQDMLAFLAVRATPGVEAVGDGAYRRTISLQGHQGWFAVSDDPANQSLAVRLAFPDSRLLFLIIERIRAMFDIDADWPAIANVLSLDPQLGTRLDAHPGLRVPGCWNGFELAVRAVVGQKISVKGATTLAGRIAQSLGWPFAAPGGLTHIFPPPEEVAEASLAAIGLTARRAETIRALARAVCDRRICFERVPDANALLAQLRAIPGIGPWTAQYVAMRALREPDAFPSGDLGLLRALDLTAAHELEQRAEAWRPWRAYAAMALWISSKEPAALASANCAAEFDSHAVYSRAATRPVLL